MGRDFSRNGCLRASFRGTGERLFDLPLRSDAERWTTGAEANRSRTRGEPCEEELC